MTSRPAQSGLFAAMLAVVIWGLVPVGTRFFVLKLDPFSFNVIRFLFSGVAALPMFMAGKPWRWPALDRRRLLLCALLAVPGYNIPVAIAARTISAGHMGMLIATEPIFIIVFGAWLHRRRIHSRVVLGGAIAFVGVALTSLAAGTPQFANWSSTLLVVGGAASWSAYTVLAASLAQRYGTFSVTGGVLVVGSIVLIGVSLPMIHTDLFPDRLVTSQLGALGLVSSLLGFLLWNHAASSVTSDRLGLLLYLLPFVSVLAGASLLNERLTGPLVLGGAITLIGVAIGERRRTA